MIYKSSLIRKVRERQEEIRQRLPQQATEEEVWPFSGERYEDPPAYSDLSLRPLGEGQETPVDSIRTKGRTV